MPNTLTILRTITTAIWLTTLIIPIGPLSYFTHFPFVQEMVLRCVRDLTSKIPEHLIHPNDLCNPLTSPSGSLAIQFANHNHHQARDFSGIFFGVDWSRSAVFICGARLLHLLLPLHRQYKSLNGKVVGIFDGTCIRWTIVCLNSSFSPCPHIHTCSVNTNVSLLRNMRNISLSSCSIVTLITESPK